MKEYKCVIFDCDGVLVDSELIGNRVMVDMANEQGATIDIEYAFKYFKGGALHDCFRRIESLLGNKLPGNFEREYRRRSFESFEKELKPVEGIVELLESLTIPFCVASSGPVNKIRWNLGLVGLLPKFEGNIFSCYDLGKWKPEPDVFLNAANTMGHEPKDCVVIEDSVVGVRAANRAGMDVFSYVVDFDDTAFKKEETTVFNDMRDLMRMLPTAL